MARTPSPYRRVEDQIKVDADRRKKEDLDAKAQLEYEKATIERDRDAKLQAFDADTQNSRKKLEENQKQKDKELKDFHEREWKELRLRQEKEQRERATEKESAIYSLDNATEKGRKDLAEIYKHSYDDLVAKFQKDQKALAEQRKNEDDKNAKEWFQALRANTLSKQVGSEEVQSLQSPASLPLCTDTLGHQRSKSSGLVSSHSPHLAEDIPRAPRAWSPPHDAYRSGRSRSPPRGRYDRSDYYSSSHYRIGESRKRSPPYSPRYSNTSGSAHRSDGYYDGPRRPRSRSPPPQSFDLPGPPHRNWSRRFSPPPPPPRDRRVFSDHSTPKDNKQRRKSSPLNTMHEDMHSNLTSIPTGPKIPTLPSRKMQRLDPGNTMSPPSGPSQPNIAANRQPAWNRPFNNPSSGKSNYLGSQTISSNAPVPSGNTLVLRAPPPLLPPTNRLNCNGVKPVGFYVGPNPAVPGSKPSLETQFPVQRVKYIEDNGKFYEWTASAPNEKPVRKAELRQVNNSFKGYQSNRSTTPSGWSIREHTVARIEYFTRWGVIRVVKLKQEDVGPKELWMEFKEPRTEVLAAFVQSFKKIDWTFYKVYPTEMPETEENPMDAALVPRENSQNIQGDTPMAETN